MTGRIFFATGLYFFFAARIASGVRGVKRQFDTSIDGLETLDKWLVTMVEFKLSIEMRDWSKSSLGCILAQSNSEGELLNKMEAGEKDEKR